MKKYVMYESLGMWYITTAENQSLYYGCKQNHQVEP